MLRVAAAAAAAAAAEEAALQSSCACAVTSLDEFALERISVQLQWCVSVTS